MRNRLLATSALAAGMVIASTHFISVDAASGPSPAMREGARTFARFDQPIAKRDLKGYCSALHDGPDYAAYVRRACESGVKNKVREPAECADAGIRNQVAQDQKRCLAMSTQEFDGNIAKVLQSRKLWLEDLANQGVDGEKLIAEERAKLK